jgi:hypothetical protein
MRLEGISSIEDANAFLDSYMTRHNERFARPAFEERGSAACTPSMANRKVPIPHATLL